MTKMILLEINEVPWRLLDKYADSERLPNLRRLLKSSKQFTTVAVDSGELSPWVTWPTLHRGMSAEGHCVRTLGQDPTTFRGTPIWEDVLSLGGSIGVCGSLQSWPPLNPGEGGFYIPDTFARDASCYPNSVSGLQALNLSMVRKNARVVSRSLLPIVEAVKGGGSAIRSGVRAKTAGRIVGQLVHERMNSSVTARRPVFQAMLFWDVFRNLMSVSQRPMFATFFTNHIAGLMHRYWDHIFPEDFPELGKRESSQGAAAMNFAFEVLDEMLADVMAWIDQDPDLIVVFASSMGQTAIHRTYHEGVELVVKDLPSLLDTAGIGDADFHPLIAMVPQVAVAIPDDSTRSLLSDALSSAKTKDGTAFISVEERGNSLSITVRTPSKQQIDLGGFQIGNIWKSWAEAGIYPQEVEAGTGYHIPEGTLLFLGQRVSPDASSRYGLEIRTDHIKDWLLRILKDGADLINSSSPGGSVVDLSMHGAARFTNANLAIATKAIS